MLYMMLAIFAKAQQPVDTATEKALDAVDPTVILRKFEAEHKDTTNFTAVEIQASFAGPGTIFQFIANNLNYPANAAKNHIQGKVIIQFTVQTSGAVDKVTVLRSVSPDLDNEAVRVIKLSIWHPAVQNGRKIAVNFAIPITFKITQPVSNNVIAESKLATDTSAQETPKTTSDNDLLNQSNPQATQKPDFSINPNIIFTAVENPPNYPGGSEKLHDYVDLYLKHVHNQYEGQEIVQFVVEKDGSLSNLKVLRGINPDADALAITIMKNCPKFNPGMQNGHVVRVYYTVALKFTTQPSE